MAHVFVGREKVCVLLVERGWQSNKKHYIRYSDNIGRSEMNDIWMHAHISHAVDTTRTEVSQVGREQRS